MLCREYRQEKNVTNVSFKDGNITMEIADANLTNQLRYTMCNHEKNVQTCMTYSDGMCMCHIVDDYLAE